MREKRKYYEEHPDEVDAILMDGTNKARAKAKEVMARVSSEEKKKARLPFWGKK